MPHRLYIKPARNYQKATAPRNRVLYALVAVAVVAAGLLWRSRFMPLPPFAAKYGGDALWALMVYLGLGFIFPRLRIPALAAVALVLTYCVEFSQLYRAEWIDAFRKTFLGAVSLGSGFLWSDLVCYTVGCGAGVLVDIAEKVSRGEKRRPCASGDSAAR